MERLSEQYGVVVQAPEKREELHRCDTGLRRADVQGTQNGIVSLQPVLQIFVRGKFLIDFVTFIFPFTHISVMCMCNP